MKQFLFVLFLALGLTTWNSCTYDTIDVVVAAPRHINCGDTTHLATLKIVMVKNFTFSPDTLTINSGDTVRFVWEQGTHTTTSSSVPGGATTWDKPMTSTDCIYEHRFTTTGTYNYVCTPHAVVMFGTIIVQ